MVEENHHDAGELLEANRRMKRTIRYGNILTVATLAVEIFLVAVANFFIRDKYVAVIVIGTVGMTGVFIIMAVALWKQSSILDVEMSLLRYI